MKKIWMVGAMRAASAERHVEQYAVDDQRRRQPGWRGSADWPTAADGEPGEISAGGMPPTGNTV